MLFQIKNWLTGKVIFEKDTSSMRLAVEFAVAENVSLHRADLRSADLRSADLSGADLRSADLRSADLRSADLSGADLSGADLSGADLSGADLRSADLSKDALKGVPVIKNIHQAVYEAASPDGALEMGDWHTCETTHCRAGWVTHLAGDAGAAMEWGSGTAGAAALIYMASDPTLEKVPDFYCSNDEALADMKRLADLEAEAS